MVDTFSREKRHEIMSKIKGKNTKIEVQVCHWLFNHGIRYRKNSKGIPGRPDISITKYKIAVFIHGCFWHGHENCKFSRMPKSNIEYWKQKIEKNIERDKVNIKNLENMGWNVFVIWGCQLQSNFDNVMNTLYEEILFIKNNISSSPSNKI